MSENTKHFRSCKKNKQSIKGRIRVRVRVRPSFDICSLFPSAQYEEPVFRLNIHKKIK
jgi:hypothetical protein